MSNKEIGNKVNKLRRTLIISTICAGVFALGVGVFAGLAAKPLIIAINGCLLTGASCLAVGCAAGINKIYNEIAIKANMEKAGKALEKIKEMDKDGSSKYSSKYRAKILRKYAKANLVLTRKLGATIFGEFHATSGMVSPKGAELINEIDAYNILKDASLTGGQKKKYGKKLDLAESKLSKIVEEEGKKSAKFKWTRSYEGVLQGVTALDRRTEISCLTSFGRDAFRMVMEKTAEKIDDKCVNVSMTFNENSGISPSIARAEDQTKASTIKDILVQDVYEACKTKNAPELRAMFPITIESKCINKKSTKLVKRDVLTIANYSELKQLAEDLTKGR